MIRKQSDFYVNVYKSGTVSNFRYQDGSVLDALLRQRGAKEVGESRVAFRVRVQLKSKVVTTDRAVDIETARKAINGMKTYTWAEAEVLPPVSQQMLKALGAFLILFLMMAFTLWFLRDLFQ